MTTGTLTMSHQELDRCEVMRRVLERCITQRQAADMLGLSLRQTERLFANYKRDGPAGLMPGKRGKASNCYSCAPSRPSSASTAWPMEAMGSPSSVEP